MENLVLIIYAILLAVILVCFNKKNNNDIVKNTKENFYKINDYQENFYKTENDQENFYQTKDDQENFYQTENDQENFQQTEDDQENFQQTGDDQENFQQTEDNQENFYQTEDYQENDDNQENYDYQENFYQTAPVETPRLDQVDLPKNIVGKGIYCIALSEDGNFQSFGILGGNIFVSNDNGQTFSKKGPVKQWNSICMSNDGQYQAATTIEKGKIYISNDAGENWNEANVPELQYSQVSMSDDGQTLLAAPYGSNLMISVDNGETWTSDSTSKSTSWYGCAISGDGSVRIGIVNGGNIFIWKSTTNKWEAVGGQTNFYWCVATDNVGKYITVPIRNAKKIDDSKIFLSSNSGAKWQQIAEKLKYTAVAMSSDGKYQVIVSSEGTIYFSQNNGANWSKNTNSDRFYQSCAISKNGNLVLLGSTLGLFKYNLEGNRRPQIV